jgi:glucan biosynthesis protein
MNYLLALCEPSIMRRRDFLKSALILAGAPLLKAAVRPSPASAQPAAKPQQFDYAWLKNHARGIACREYGAPNLVLPNILTKLDYDDYQAIRLGAERALWVKDGLAFRIGYFHRGPMFKEAVRMHEIVGGQASAILYDPAMFDFSRTQVSAGDLSKDLGFAGFRVQFHTDGAPISQPFSAPATSVRSAAITGSTEFLRVGWPSIQAWKRARNFRASPTFGSSGQPRIRSA